MKKIKLILGLLILNLFVRAQDNISLFDKYLISEKLEDFVSAVNTKDYEIIPLLVSSAAPEVVSSIQEKIEKTKEYAFEYDLSDSFVEVEKEGKRVKVVGKYQKSGINNKLSWISGYFVFEKQGDHWFIVETDFYEESFVGLLLSIFGSLLAMLFLIFLIPIIIFLPTTMLIDCAKNPVKNKALWVFLLHFFNIAAAIPYYFIIRRNRKKVAS